MPQVTSSALRHRRASPSAVPITILRASSVSSNPGNSRSNARSMSSETSSADKGSRTYTAERLSNAELTSKEGFSVVAPTKMKSPDSTCGKNASCWLLLKRCTSSTKTNVGICRCVIVTRASSTASRISLTPLRTAEIAINGSPNASAMRRASVVFPTPGGPQRIIECGRCVSNATRKGCPGPSSFF